MTVPTAPRYPSPAATANDMPALTPEQRARVAALRAANGVLNAPDPIDLVNVAQYIVTGDDPWESSITRIATAAADTAATALGDAIGNTTTGGEDREDQ